MAQTIKLRRSATEGKVPTTSQLALGEIAINTYDGRIFFEKNDGSATIEHIVTTNSTTTGSIELVSPTDGAPIFDLKTTHAGVNGPKIRFFKDGASPATDDSVGSLLFLSDDSAGNLTQYGTITVNISNVTSTDEAGRMELQVVSSDGTTATNRPGIRIEGHPTSDYVNVDLGNGASSTTSISGSLNITTVANQASEATSLMINGSGVVGTRELGSNAFTSTTIGTTTNALTDGTGIADFSFDGSGTATISTDDSAIVHDNLSGFVANEHIDHSSVSITAGTGLNGGGDLTSTRTLNVDDDYKNTSLNAATSSYLTTVDISDDTNLAVADTSQVNMILSGDTLSAELIGGVVSGSAQIADVTLTTAAQTNITSLGTLTSLTVDDITINGSTISDGGDLTLDANGDIILDANGADIKLEDNGTAFGRLKRSSSDFVIKSDSNNNNIIFKGVDNSATITALTLDMSDAGTAIFEHDVKVVGNISGSSFDGTGLISGAAQVNLGSAAGTVDISSQTNLAVADTSEVNMILTGDTISAELIGGVVSGSSQVVTAATVKSALNGNLGTLTLGDSDDTVSIPGNLNVAGTRTVVESTTVQLNDNILELNGGASSDGGIYVRDAEGGTNVTGSLIWNTVSDNWTAGPKGSEDDVVLRTLSQTLTNKTLTSPDVNSPDIDGGTIDGATIATSDITVGSGKTLNVSGGTLTTSTAQKVAIIGGGDTDDLSEGSSNLYFTTDRARAAISAGEGIDISSGEISGENATTSNKGIASFSSDNFSVSSGAVTIKNSGVSNDELAGSIANGKLLNSAITISGTSVSLGGSITDETLFGGVGVVTGSAQVAHDSTNGFVANEHIDHSGVSISSGDGLTGGGTIQSTRTLAVDYSTSSDNVVSAADTGTPAGTSTLLFADTGGVNKVALNSLNISLLNNNSGFGTGSVTNVTVGTGLDVSTGTTTPAISLDLTEITLGAGLDSTATGLSLDLSEFTDMTADVVGSQDELILLDNGSERKKMINEIKLSQFNNDSAFLTSVDLTSDVTGILPSANLDSDTAHLSGTQTFSGTKTFTNETTHNGGIKLGNDDKIRWTSDDVYIAGTTSGDNLDFVAGGNSVFNISQTDIDMKIPVNVDDSTQSTTKTTGCMIIDGGVGIAKTLNVGEDVVAFASSDERYKDLITPIENPNEKIKLLSGNTFVWNDKHEVFKGKKDIGVIAQEVEKVFPEIVDTRDDGYKAVKYEKLVALLIESNKELIKRVEELESKIK